MKPIIFVLVGPTAVGKTEFAISLAQRIGGEIISVDSRSFYRHLDIGTAKPSKKEMESAPHHLVDILDPDEPFSLADFLLRVDQEIAGIVSRGKLPILVGGTGQYIHAITRGWSIPDISPNEKMRSILSKLAGDIGASELHHKLAILDPLAASHIQYQNVRRTIRALEVIIITGQKFSTQSSQNPVKYKIFMAGLSRPRSELYQRVDDRITHMFTRGWLEEVKALIESGFSFDTPAFSAIGYRELLEVVNGVKSLSEAELLIKRKSRIFIRRQANWFKESDPDIHWVYPNDEGMKQLLQQYDQFIGGANE